MEVRLDDASGVRWVRLRAVTGADELRDVAEAGGVARLVDGLLCDAPGAICGVGEVGRLALWEHDLVLAAVYRELFGERIECSLACAACGDGLAASFSSTELVETQHEANPADAEIRERLEGPDAEGAYTLEPGVRFRLPTVGDLDAVRGLGTEAAARALEQRCVLSAAGEHRDAVDRAMALLGPRLVAELDDIRCPACGHEQAASFDIESFLGGALERERPLVVREVHLLARAYHWSRTEILEMPRQQRHWHVGMVLAELSGGRRPHA